MLQNTKNKVEISLGFGELKPILHWCEDNCTGEWAYFILEPAGQGKGEYEFYFEDDSDKVKFIMWKT
jgi:predicted lipoprotein with Yx(FWY)xxD motif